MATTNSRAPSATPAPLSSIPTTNGNSVHAHLHAHDDILPNGHHVPVQEPRLAPTPTPAMASNTSAKKGKGKKPLDSNEASKLVAARISQLEVDTAAEKEQEAEIGRSFPSLRRLYILGLSIGDIGLQNSEGDLSRYLPTKHYPNEGRPAITENEPCSHTRHGAFSTVTGLSEHSNERLATL